MDKNKFIKFGNISKNLCLILGYVVLIIGVIFFTIINNAVFFNSVAMKCIFAFGLLLFPALLLNKKQNKTVNIISIILFLVCIGLFLYIVLDGLILDYFQPLSLSTLTSILLIVGVVMLLIGGAISLFTKKGNITFATCTTLVVLMLSGLIWANTAVYKDFTNCEHTLLFNPNESGYATFRIPSIYAVDKNTLNNNGFNIASDPLYAFCEGRINSSHDKGDIDIVYKYSTDSGNTWSEVKTLLTFGDEVGKYGNPTVVFNKHTGSFHLFYMKASSNDNYHYKSYHSLLKIKEDFSLSIDNNSTKDISLTLDANNEKGGSDGVRSDTLMVGPGKGAYIENGKYTGRIVMPCSNNGHSFVVFSDDDGITWNNLATSNEVKSAGFGNECEATFVNDKLVMVVRENRGCSTFHSKQFQRFSISNDGGATWQEKTIDSTLKSPICMSSVATYNNKLILTYPDDFFTRANLSLAISDGNASFNTLPLYSGATGYSCVTVDSDNNIFVLAEIGKINYNENLVFIKVDTSKLQKWENIS